jgi:hypothetical protein
VKQMKVGLLALFALLAVTAFAATAAQATPELLVVKLTEKEAEKLPNKIEGTGGVGLLNTVGGNNIECTANAVAGEQTSTTKGKVTVKFTGCSKGCKTGTVAKEVVINPGPTPAENALFVLDSEVGSTHIYGILAKEPYPEIKCTGLTVLVEGELIIPTTLKLVTKTLTTTVETTESALGVQSVKTCAEPAASCGTKFLKANFGSAFEEAALVGSDSIKFENEVEPVN